MEINFNGIDIDSDQYQLISRKLVQFKLACAKYSKRTLSNLAWSDYKKYCEEKLGYVFTYINTLPNIGGRTRIIDGTVSIIINSNPKINKGRLHFTYMHEISHAIMHFNGAGEKNLFFASNTDAPKDYLETEADIGASLLMADDLSLKKFATYNNSFETLCDLWGYSKSAFKIRLRNYLIFNLSLSPQLAFKLINDFEYYGNNTLLFIIRNFRELQNFFDQGYADLSYPDSLENCFNIIQCYSPKEAERLDKKYLFIFYNLFNHPGI
ncbi:ImmA/IrrE family metallo-endopeptidase [Pediococcus inopinatus]|uniref:ImmA/IrrE family metallo-endopeptidase n=1 Tax=Pediococcus inopinatus TaxID=114090 RepID=UPI002B25FA1D|nr:ImmA/IrrE family metallo-endopeptidase [Pediococcus inopinatus]WPC19493.1 ImmA/IrrE family metallo-endopeptidase [Pediococcus inopinatus]